MRPFDPRAQPRSWVAESAPRWRDIDSRYTSTHNADAVYRFYDANEQLLYIGMTGGSPYMRWTDHRRDSAWWSLAAYVSILWVAGGRDACAAVERAAIRAERPPYNKEHNRPRVRMELRLDTGPDGIVEQLRHVLFPDDFASLVAAFAAESGQV
jgi:hypothetical protein